METFLVREYFLGMREELYGEVIRCSRLRVELRRTKNLIFYTLITSAVTGLLAIFLINDPMVVKVVLGSLAVMVIGSVIAIAKTFRLMSQAYYDLSGSCQQLLNNSLLQDAAAPGPRRPSQTTQSKEGDSKDPRFIWLH